MLSSAFDNNLLVEHQVQEGIKLRTAIRATLQTLLNQKEPLNYEDVNSVLAVYGAGFYEKGKNDTDDAFIRRKIQETIRQLEKDGIIREYSDAATQVADLLKKGRGRTNPVTPTEIITTPETFNAFNAASDFWDFKNGTITPKNDQIIKKLEIILGCKFSRVGELGVLEIDPESPLDFEKLHAFGDELTKIAQSKDLEKDNSDPKMQLPDYNPLANTSHRLEKGLFYWKPNGYLSNILFHTAANQVLMNLVDEYNALGEVRGNYSRERALWLRSKLGKHVISFIKSDGVTIDDADMPDSTSSPICGSLPSIRLQNGNFSCLDFDGVYLSGSRRGDVIFGAFFRYIGADSAFRVPGCAGVPVLADTRQS